MIDSLLIVVSLAIGKYQNPIILFRVKWQPLLHLSIILLIVVKFPVREDHARWPRALSATRTLLPAFGSSADNRCRKMRTVCVLSRNGGASHAMLRAWRDNLELT